MGLPSKKRTSQSKHDRASHFALKHRSLGSCAKCGKNILSHRVCPHCGTYKGKLVLKVKTKPPARTKK